MSGDPRLQPPLRRQTALFVATLYAAAVSLLLVSSWLLLSNVDQLLPRALTHTQEMEAWRTTEQPRVFAGALWSSAAFWRSLNLSLCSSTITALIAALLGIPAAYALSRYAIFGRRLIDLLFSSLIVLPASSVGLCLIVVFQYGPLFQLQQWLGIQVAHSLFPGVVLAQLVLSLAMGLSAWRATFDGINPRFEQVARSLGASPWRTFYTVTLPLSRPGLFAGFILAWVRAMAEFGAVLLFCGTFRELPLGRFSELTRSLQLQQADILPVAMWSEIEYGNLEGGFGMAFALVAISALSVYALHRLGSKGYIW